MSDRAQTAYHEAGHAVLAYITGVYVLDGPIVTVGLIDAETPVKRDHLRCVHRAAPLGGLDCVDHDYEEAIILAAGCEAQRKYLRLSGIDVNEEALFRGAHGDVKRVIELLGKVRWFEVCKVASRYLEDAGIWCVVHSLACAILRSDHSMPADTATEIMENACLEFEVDSIQVLSANAG